ncbi:MAG: biopolymer transporter ExbD [Rickettsiaceae bacterium]|jgi:biopolymer transport protein ExbD|nr:biopolymer transporter ExbD [Rickettsiaceae bacterium]
MYINLVWYMKITRARKSKKGRIEIIPMIDVMFFLLATFMLASLSMQKINSLPVNLPRGQAESSNHDKKITLTIDKNNMIYLNNSQLSIDEITQKTSPLIKEGFGNVMIINADKLASHGVVTEAMLKAKSAGIVNFSIMTKE